MKNILPIQFFYKPVWIITVVLLISLSGIRSASGQDIPDRPIPPRLLVDYAGTLSSAEQGALERKLVRFNDTTSNQILVIITTDLYGYDISEFTDRIGDKWGVGQADLDNGIVVVVKPKTTRENGLAWISVGYGLEGAIPDITTGRIIDQEMIPYFQRNDYYGGLDAATTVLMELAAGEYTSDEYTSKQDDTFWAIPIIMIIIFLIILFRRRARYSQTIGSQGMSPWTAMWLGGMMGSAGRGGWGGSSGGSFGGGGGFGGFGGGGFGGGGAGGSW
ncbi:MAG TPA: TPM domain-containing protein [Bacteroidales bacterium]|nr:TPM domain-containing protein [Bacteroidales bacterium]